MTLLSGWKYLSPFVLLMCLNASRAQTIEQVSPGTVHASIEWLKVTPNGSVCGQEKSFIGEVRILDVLRMGSGVVNVPSAGDTLTVEIKKLGNSLPDLEVGAAHVLKENLCLSANGSYYTIFVKD